MADSTQLQPLEAALKYAEMGYAVFPCKRHLKSPLTLHGCNDAVTDTDQIRKWWTQHPQANVAAITGKVFLIDVDDAKPWFDQLPESKRKELLATSNAITPRGGFHFWFRLPDNSKLRGSVKQLPGVDTRGEGGYGLLPPSVVNVNRDKNGACRGGELLKSYVWQRELVPLEELPLLPTWLQQELQVHKEQRHRTHETKDIVEGNRNDALASVAGSMRRNGADPQTIERDLLAFNLARCKPPLPIGEVLATAKSVSKYPTGSQAQAAIVANLQNATGWERIQYLAGLAPTESDAKGKMPFNPAQEAALVLSGMGPAFHQSGQWYVYREGIYTPLRQEEIVKRIRSSFIARCITSSESKVRETSGMAATLVTLDPGRTLPTWLESERFETTSYEQLSFEAEGTIVTANGVLSLPALIDNKATCFVPHTPQFAAMWKLPFEYTPDATAPTLWLQTLGQIFKDDEESISTLQEWFGYVVSGSTKHHKMLLLLGQPASGKGVICNIMTALVGEWNTATIQTSNLEDRFGLQDLIGKPLAMLRDARLSKRADSPKIVERLLSLCTGDPLQVDRKHVDPITVALPSRIVWTSNEPPILRENSDALQRRLLVLKTLQSFLGREDPDLFSKLKAELPSILLWAVEGYQRLAGRNMFVQPKAGEAELAMVRALGNPLHSFTETHCVIQEAATVEEDQLFCAWGSYAKSCGLRPGTKTKFIADISSTYSLVQHRPSSDGRPRMLKGLALIDGDNATSELETVQTVQNRP